ncbi:putative 2og-fe oxygenase superfamily protein [Cladorrhinum sp. PSN259]|nr:putative 2og-fe oxygenase superfamily protein [Cladorrhinum sp. PSN259]
MTMEELKTTLLHLAAGDGPITRTILSTPLRDATPSEIPIIDLSALSDQSSTLSDRRRIAAQIRDAATTNGFFYVTNHGISTAFISATHAASLDFFRQPPELKEPANTANSKAHTHMDGWHPPLSMKANPFEGTDSRESFVVRYDPANDPEVPRDDRTGEPIVPDRVRAALKLDEADGFPFSKTDGTCPQLKKTLVPLYQDVLGLGRKLVRCFALALGLEEDGFDDKFEWPDAVASLSYYPHSSASSSSLASVQPGSDGSGDVDSVVELGSHTDFQLFTILWQDQTGGLEVLDRKGQWLRAKPIEGTFVVNFADYMQRITNDKWLSTVHRARNLSGRERLSMPFFFGFNLDKSCGVLDSCLEEGEEKKYDKITCREWVEKRIKALNVPLQAEI